MGHESRPHGADHGRVPEPRNDGEQRALEYMGLAPGTAMEDIAVDRVFIGSCTNSRLGDLRAAAEIVRGRQVAPGVQVLVVPGSMAVKRAAEAEGLDRVFTDAGCEWRERGLLDVPRHESRRRGPASGWRPRATATSKAGRAPARAPT